MIVPEGKTIYIGSKKFKAGDTIPDSLKKIVKDKWLKTEEPKKQPVKNEVDNKK